jgi:YVTN family beta-propeller protein
MRLIVALLILGCVVSLSPGQWVEKVIPLPDSLSGLHGICAIQFHPPNNAIYVGDNEKLIVVDAATHEKLARVDTRNWLNIMCSSTASNKLYGGSFYDRTVWVVDCAANCLTAEVLLDGDVRDFCYVEAENKMYVACPSANMVDVIDCQTDSVVARIHLPTAPSALCYSPTLNRVYSAQSMSDEVAVIDCSADTIVRTIWVRGVEPVGVCYDSVTNYVYTANGTSGTVSVLDCAGDTLVRIVSVGQRPWNLQVGPQGKVFCAGDDTVLAVIDGSETRTIPFSGGVWRSSYDPTNRKVYYAAPYSGVVTVVDAVGDSILAEVSAGGESNSLCYDPVNRRTWAGGEEDAVVGVIDGATNRLTGTLWLGVFYPGAMRYNPLNNHLYCLEQGWGNPTNHLVIIDGDSGHVQKILPAGSPTDSITWNPANNKVYFGNARDNTVTILDCVNDSVVATLQVGESPGAMCCSDDGKVYVITSVGGIHVIDGSGDSLRKVILVTDHPWALCYDRTDNKVYVGKWYGDPVSVIDVGTDSVVATIPVLPSYYDMVCWDQNHNKVYVYGSEDDSVSVIDCAGDTVLRNIKVTTGLGGAYSDTTRDKIYFADANGNYLRVVNTESDTFYKSVSVGTVNALLGNGRPGSEGRVYCTDLFGGAVHVVDCSTDSVLRSIGVGVEPTGVAWNSAHARMYVSNYNSSSITVLMDTFIPGIEENRTQAASCGPRPTVVKGVLFLPAASSHKPQAAGLLDISGRKILDLKPGENDVRALAPGVYFVRYQQEKRSLKIVVQR